MKGIIVYSFALRSHEPNPCNLRLARTAKRIKEEYESRGEQVLIVAQKTVAKAIRLLGVPVDLTITHYKNKGTTDTEDITAQAADFFQAAGLFGDDVDEVTPVAHPVQAIKCKQEVERNGFEMPSFAPLLWKLRSIGFDRFSKQWWTRGPIRLVIGAARQVLLGFNTRENGPTELSE